MPSTMTSSMNLKARRPSSPLEATKECNKRPRFTPSTRLCAQCHLMKLDRSFKRAHKFYAEAREGINPRSQELHRDNDRGPMYYDDAFLVHRFKNRLSTPSDCPLCIFFRSMRVLADNDTNYKLLAFCSSEASLFCLPILKESRTWDLINHTVFMAVVPDVTIIPSHGHEESWLEKAVPAVGAIHRLRPDEPEDANAILNVRQLHEKVDFSILRGWLQFCNTHHDVACKHRVHPGSIARGFRLIDCFKDSPIIEDQPWGTPYAALSYMWGENSKEEWPNTVLDAVAATKEMGLQYLWVDRRCINYGDEEETQYLIANMTTIYSEASFTIVAAAGSGASYGIPGVGATPRKPQPKFELGSGSMLVSTLQDTRLELQASEWYTRGWTYQEGILSNRRLIFTEHQAYWECRCMAINESVVLPLDLVHEPAKKRMADFMLGGMFKSIAYSGGLDDDDGDVLIGDDSYRLDYGFPVQGSEGTIRGNLRGLDEHIRAFSSRTLGRDTDSLIALKGILGLYKQHEGLHAFLGVPIWIGHIAGGQAGVHITFAFSISSWYHRCSSTLRMFASENCTRRPHLPSWTWAGWKGTVSWRAPPQEEHSYLICNLIETDELDFLWAADMYLRDAVGSAAVCLTNVYSAQDLANEDLKVLEVRDPLVLKYFKCTPRKEEWSWRRHAGRQGREKYDAGGMAWDTQKWRLAGRLVFISISLKMTRAEWTEKHFSGELISVLVFAGRDPQIRHGRAKLLTIRKVQESTEEVRWERVGIVQLTVSDEELSKSKTNETMLEKLPVKRGEADLVIH
jgi:hypothetical protein